MRTAIVIPERAQRASGTQGPQAPQYAAPGSRLSALTRSGRDDSVVIALVAALLLTLSLPAHAQEPDIDAGWRQIFKREVTPPSPLDNPLTPEKAALGAKLFTDTRLSGSGQRACVTCHRPERAFTDGRPRAAALSGAPLLRNTPSLWNLAWGKHYFWDGRASSLEEQAAIPIENPKEMGAAWSTLLPKLQADAALLSEFRSAFPGDTPLSKETVTMALASYVRSLVSPPTRFDAWIEGDKNAISPAEQRGFRLFNGKAACVLCHVGWRFTDDRFHDIGLASKDPGRGAVPDGTKGLAAFKTPSLRELKFTAPYMHDGSLPTLEAVVAHYSGGFVARTSLSTHINRNLRLTAAEKSDLVAFLATLSSTQKPTRP